MSGFGAVLRLDGAPVSRAETERMAGALSPRWPARGGPVFAVLEEIGLVGPAAPARHSAERAAGLPADEEAELVLAADLRLTEYERLRSELAVPAEPGRGDAWLVLAAYRRWGRSCVEHLAGDFAFALWDGRRRLLLCARDPMGVRPLAFARAGGRFLVASDARQIISHGALPLRLDTRAAVGYLLALSREDRGYLYEGVRALLPGSALVVDPNGIRQWRYWPLRPPPPVRRNSLKANAIRLRRVLEKAVVDQVPRAGEGGTVGVLMSAGIDSCGIASLATRILGTARVKAYHYSFARVPACDESRAAEALAAELGISLSHIRMDGRELLEESLPSQDDPFRGWSRADVELRARLEEDGVTVLLTGYCGDFGRLGNDRTACVDRLLRGDPAVVAEALAQGRRLGMAPWRSLFAYFVKPLLPASLLRMVARVRGHKTGSGLPPWLTPAAAAMARDGLTREPCGARRLWDAHRALGAERAADMGNVRLALTWYRSVLEGTGTEPGFPLADRRLADFFYTVEPGHIFAPGWNRRIVRCALAGILPDRVRLRQDKTVFPPYLSWMLRSDPGRRVATLLEDPVIARLGLVDAERLRWTVAESAAGRLSVEETGLLWFPLTLELWLRREFELS